MNGTLPLTIQSETLLLHPERAVIWPRLAALIVADTHFGKTAVFGRHGRAVPAGSDERDRGRLTRLIESCGIRRLFILGDFLHEPLELHSQEAMDMERWCLELRLSGLEIRVIAGNHDRGVSRGWRGGIEWIAEAHEEGPFRFVHDYAQGSPSENAFSMSGHIHPVVSLNGLRKRPARVPAFWLRPRDLVLPSFGSFTGGYRVSAGPGERIFAVSPERVLAFPGFR
jgi:uncharacterized protein